MARSDSRKKYGTEDETDDPKGRPTPTPPATACPTVCPYGVVGPLMLDALGKNPPVDELPGVVPDKTSRLARV